MEAPQISVESIYTGAFMQGLKLDPRLTVSEWADKYRFLSQKAAAEPGPWRTSRTPYLQEIMDCLSSNNPIQRVVFQAGAQIGKTECGNNWFGYVVHQAPGPMMIVQPTVDLAKRLSKQRLAPTIEESPVLRERIAEARARDSGNTMLVKEFLGGVLILTGANSAVGLRSMPVKNLFLDEIDAYPSDVEGEGDPVKLAERRTTTFARRKILMVSTPTIKDISRIEKEYLLSDQRKYYVPCPHCGNMDYIRWGNIVMEDLNPKTAKLLCCVKDERGNITGGCGVLIEEHYKTEMLMKGEWRATAPSDGRTAGFHLSSLYSPLGWKSWAEICEEFLNARNDPPMLKEWVNTVLGETWEEEYSAKIGAEGLAERVEEYKLLSVPEGGLLLTAGVDVQDNRLAVSVRAWGEGEESWLINWLEIYGDPARPEVWEQLDSVLDQDYPHINGTIMKIRASGIDTGGHFTHEVYSYCRQRKHRGRIALKGQSQPGKPAIGKPSRQDVNYKNQTIKKGVDLWPVGVDTIKSVIYGRLKNPLKTGTGVYHFPLETPLEYFKQLTAEKQITKYRNGFPVRVWMKKEGVRNEALDCEVYAYAALQYFYTRVNRNTLWLQLKEKLDKVKKQEEKPREEIPAEKPQTSNKPVGKKRRNSFVKGWK